MNWLLIWWRKLLTVPRWLMHDSRNGMGDEERWAM